VLDAFVVTPNHVHGIVVIYKPVENGVETLETPNLGVSTGDTNNPNRNHQTVNARKKWKPATLVVIINQGSSLILCFIF
jgi:REP element-mobilizing transposase RayT